MRIQERMKVHGGRMDADQMRIVDETLHAHDRGSIGPRLHPGKAGTAIRSGISLGVPQHPSAAGAAGMLRALRFW